MSYPTAGPHGGPGLLTEEGMMRIIDMRPPRIAAVLLVISIALWRFSPQDTVLHFHYKLIGILCVALGTVTNIWGWALFRKARTALCPKAGTSVLVTTGIYGITRNPMYLGMLLTLAGAAFFMGSIPSLFAPVAFFLITDKVFIPYEEDKLLENFGAEYSGYMSITNRWI